jgi:O-acetyl-ADP-ribose deacetylase (regulator of RNase III)
LLTGGKVIINFPTKEHWGSPSEYRFIEQGLIALVQYLNNSSIETLALPALGCGNGGLNWLVVKEMIEQYLDMVGIVITVFEPLPI